MGLRGRLLHPPRGPARPPGPAPRDPHDPIKIAFNDTVPAPKNGFYSPLDYPHDRFDVGFDNIWADPLDFEGRRRGGVHTCDGLPGEPRRAAVGRPVLPEPPGTAAIAAVLGIGDVHPRDMPYDLLVSATTDYLGLPEPSPGVLDWLPDHPDADGRVDGPTFGRPLADRGDGPFLTLREFFFPNDPRLALAVANYATAIAEVRGSRGDRWVVSLPTVVPTLSGRLRHAGRLILIAGADAPGKVEVAYEGERGLVWPNTPGRRRASGPVVHVQDPLEALAWERAAAGAASVVAECAAADEPGRSRGLHFSDRRVRALHGGGQNPAASDAFVLGQILTFEDASCGGSVAEVRRPHGESGNRDAGLGRPPANRKGARLLIDEAGSPFLRYEWSFEVAMGGPFDSHGMPERREDELRIHDPDRHPFRSVNI